jgi:[ribosomal protein S5]-alanine N-acetyltransferase
MRPWHPDDAEAFHAVYRQPEVVRYLGTTQPTTSVEDARARLEALAERYRPLNAEGFAFWSLADEEAICGSMMLKPIPWSKEIDPETPRDIEIGWHLSPAVWGRGYATEAGRRILEHAWQIGLSRVVAVADEENVASHRVMERLGMELRGRTRDYYDVEVVLYTLEK